MTHRQVLPHSHRLPTHEPQYLSRSPARHQLASPPPKQVSPGIHTSSDSYCVRSNPRTARVLEALQYRTEPSRWGCRSSEIQLNPLTIVFGSTHKHRHDSKMSTATRVMLSRALRRSLPHQKLLLPQQRGLATQVDDKTAGPGHEQSVHGFLKNAYFNTHHPVSTAVSWGEEFWRNVPVYRDVSSKEFLSYSWSVSDFPNMPMVHFSLACVVFLANLALGKQTKNAVDSHHRLYNFLNSVVPDEIPDGAGTQSKEEFMEDVYDGIKASTMSLRITQVNHSYSGLKNHTNIESQALSPQPHQLAGPQK